MSRTATPSVGPLSSYAMSSTLVRTRLRTARWFMACRSGLGLAGALLLLALAQVIFGRASLGSWRGGVGIELLLGDRHDPAVLAHLDHVEALRGILEHPVLALELGGDALDRAFDPERLVAADAVERLFLFKHACARRRGAEIELRPQGDHLLRRSEEHTSELQSHSDLVCRLLLEKKKKHDGHLGLQHTRSY